MLDSVNLNDKTYEELLAEAISRIPLYSREWTNYNRSEPGIAVIQNFTAFNHVQQEQINEVTEAIRLRLLGLLGFHKGRNVPSKVLVKMLARHACVLPPHTKMFAGDVQFETTRELTLAPWDISRVVSLSGGEERDITFLLSRDVFAGAFIFGQHPKSGDRLVLMLGGCPKKAGHSINIWVEVADSDRRNAFSDAFPVSLSALRWQCYTAGGWEDVEFKDGTSGFLQSGAVCLTVPKQTMTELEAYGGRGYALRCTLEAAEYDIAPKVQSMTANLFEMEQRRTCAAVFRERGGERVTLSSELAATGHLFVYCREDGISAPYRAYTEVTPETEVRGRHFFLEPSEDGGVTVCFDRERFGAAPHCSQNAVMVVACDEEAVLHREVGVVYGYEDQQLELEGMRGVVPEGFALLAEEEDENGEPYYYIVEPMSEHPDVIAYELSSADGAIRIKRPAVSGACTLYLASCALTLGREGAIRRENALSPVLKSLSNRAFTNPGGGYGGETEENAEQLRQRFLSDMRSPSTAVTAKDYETLTLGTPGLCIHRVKAVADEVENLVYVAVKPHSLKACPTLSPKYISVISAWLERHRMVTTRVALVQPEYVKIDVQTTVYVKNYAEKPREEIERMLRDMLDYAAAGRDFGETLYYHEVFRRLEELPCVDSVYSLSFMPQNRTLVEFRGPDIVMNFKCFCRPGQLSVQVNPRER